MIHLPGGVGANSNALVAYSFEDAEEDGEIEDASLTIFLSDGESLTIDGAEAKAAYMQLLSIDSTAKPKKK